MSNCNNRYGNYKKYLNKRVQQQENCCVPGPPGPRGPQGMPGEPALERLASIAIEPWSPPGHKPIWDFPNTTCSSLNEYPVSLYQQFHAHGGLYRKISIRIAPTYSTGSIPQNNAINGVKLWLGIFDNSFNCNFEVSDSDPSIPGSVDTGGFPLNLLGQTQMFEFNNTACYQNQYLDLDLNNILGGAGVNLIPNERYWMAIGVVGGSAPGYSRVPIAYRDNENSQAATALELIDIGVDNTNGLLTLAPTSYSNLTHSEKAIWYRIWDPSSGMIGIGPQGLTGFQGFQGSQGSQGHSGFQGDTGTQGFQGHRHTRFSRRYGRRYTRFSRRYRNTRFSRT